MDRMDVMSCIEAFSGNPYPGRGIVAGVDDTGENLVQIYWIMGRSGNSRNRVFVLSKNGRLSTAPADLSIAGDASLTIYNAMREVRTRGTVFAAVSNGHQTNAVVQGVERHQNLWEALETYSYEPDSPNYTPRITALSYWSEQMTEPRLRQSVVAMSSLVRSSFNDSCERNFTVYERVTPGVGYCLTTYRGDGNPLPPYDGKPYPLMLRGDIEDLTDTFESALRGDNLVSLAVKFVPRNGGESKVKIYNKYRQKERQPIAAVK